MGKTTLYTNHSASPPRKSLPLPSYPITEHNYSSVAYTTLLSNFFKDLGYAPPIFGNDGEFDVTTTDTYKILRAEFLLYGLDEQLFETICLTACDIAELSYGPYSSEVKLQIAKYSWYLVYIDDQGGKILPELKAFHQSFFRPQISENPILRDFRKNLADMYNLWDPIAANCIVTSSLDFVNGCIMEEDPTVKRMKLSDVATSWPYYLRRLTGASAAYAYMMFPKNEWSDISIYVQVVDDIMLIINILNDLLSYHKEALAGETKNYICNRAYVTGRNISDTLQEVAEDILAANRRITEVFESTEGAIAWKHFLTGYTDFNVYSKRYRIRELHFN